MLPLVSVICISYNHKPYIRDAIYSVKAQTYPNIEIVVVDDASTDETWQELEKLKLELPDIEIFRMPINSGICVTFNTGFGFSKGKFWVDMSGDDLMLPGRIEAQVNAFRQLSADFGAVYCRTLDADVQAGIVGKHAAHFKKNLPSGDVFADVLAHYFIYTGAVLFKREVFEQLKGYDESLLFEDFDWLVRSSRKWKFQAVEEALHIHRVVPGSMGKQFLKKRNRLAKSTYLVCEKAYKICISGREFKSLEKRIVYEAKRAMLSANFSEVELYYGLISKVKKASLLNLAKVFLMYQIALAGNVWSNKH